MQGTTDLPITPINRSIYRYRPIIGLANHRNCNIVLVLDQPIIGGRGPYGLIGMGIQRAQIGGKLIQNPQKNLNTLTTSNLSKICDSKLKILFSQISVLVSDRYRPI